MDPNTPLKEPDSKPAAKEDIKPLESADAQSKKAIQSDNSTDRVVRTNSSSQNLRKRDDSGYRRIDDRPLL